MALISRQPFSPHGNYVARKSFLYDGQNFKSGDIFPHEELGIDERKLSKLFEANFIMHAPRVIMHGTKENVAKTIKDKKPDVVKKSKKKKGSKRK